MIIEIAIVISVILLGISTILTSINVMRLNKRVDKLEK